jgi:hypothetical protein
MFDRICLSASVCPHLVEIESMDSEDGSEHLGTEHDFLAVRCLVDPEAGYNVGRD